MTILSKTIPSAIARSQIGSGTNPWKFWCFATPETNQQHQAGYKIT
ncbi:hypothetical protein [Halothece sp. PCC 7418]|nr:hypothetical protein [Halothece sp. PCC 7418]